MVKLTERQQGILEFILLYFFETQCKPTIREIGARFDIRSTNGVQDHLKALYRKGYLEFSEGSHSRALKLLKPAMRHVLDHMPVRYAKIAEASLELMLKGEPNGT